MGLRDLYKGSRLGGGKGYIGYGDEQWAPGANIYDHLAPPHGGDREGLMGRMARYKLGRKREDIADRRGKETEEYESWRSRKLGHSPKSGPYVDPETGEEHPHYREMYPRNYQGTSGLQRGEDRYNTQMGEFDEELDEAEQER